MAHYSIATKTDPDNREHDGAYERIVGAVLDLIPADLYFGHELWDQTIERACFDAALAEGCEFVREQDGDEVTFTFDLIGSIVITEVEDAVTCIPDAPPEDERCECGAGRRPDGSLTCADPPAEELDPAEEAATAKTGWQTPGEPATEARAAQDETRSQQGRAIVKLLGLKRRIWGSKDSRRVDTLVGDKTDQGLARTVARVFDDPSFVSYLLNQ